MYTAKDMWKDLKEHETFSGKIVDTWLKDEVLPSKIRDKFNNSYKMPPEFDGMGKELILKLLKERGFDADIVPSNFAYNEFIIVLNIPPQGE